MVASRSQIPQLDSKYDKLRYCPEKGSTEIPFIVGMYVRVDTLYRLDYMAWKQTPEEIAKSRRLPPKVVKQAIAWCEDNKDLVSRVIGREARSMRIK